MKKFLIISSLLSILVIATLIACEPIVRSMPNKYKSKNEYMLKNGTSVETLIFGTSHTYYGINPEFLDGNVYSLANISQGFRYDYYLLTHYADKYQKLKTIIVPVSYFSFFSTPFGVEDNTKHYITSYHLYMDCPYGSGSIRYSLELADWTLFKEKLMACITHSFRDCSPLGFGLDFSFANRPKGSIKAVDETNKHTAKDWRYFKTHLKELTDIADFCKEHNIRLILITTPTFHTYYETVDVKQLNKMYSTIEMIKNKYHLSYFNHFKDDRFVEDDFWDDDHLNDVGAEKFTRILNEEIKNNEL